MKRTKASLILLLIPLLAASLGCQILQRSVSPEAVPELPQATMDQPTRAVQAAAANPLVGSWRNDDSGEITEYTETQMIVKMEIGKVYVDYTLIDDHTYRTKIEGAADVEFKVDGNTLTIIGTDGKARTYTRVK